MDSPASHRISVPGGTLEPDRSQSVFAYGTITLFGRLSHTILLTNRFMTLVVQALQPRSSKPDRFGLFPFRSPLLGESHSISFPLGTKMFQFPRFPSFDLCVQSEDAVGLQQRVSPFGDPRIGACSRLPEAYRSVPRPSSAFDAKASTVSP